ncbi:MAG: hypothetical protein CM1200mP28_12490 [Deltaproteobacteria bacterium]|nr:MAG: hypothetical protein CM1200mP28_12490 [Deltaproteobacteria bacterium]
MEKGAHHLLILQGRYVASPNPDCVNFVIAVNVNIQTNQPYKFFIKNFKKK